MGDEKAGSCGKRSIQMKEIKANKRKMENGWLAQSTSRISFMKRKDQLSRIHIRTGSCFFSHSILISFFEGCGSTFSPSTSYKLFCTESCLMDKGAQNWGVSISQDVLRMPQRGNEHPGQKPGWQAPATKQWVKRKTTAQTNAEASQLFLLNRIVYATVTS